MFQDFKKFALRGNVLDMAIGIIIGASFSTIVKSLVDDLIMPPIGLLLGRVDFSNTYLLLKEGKVVGPYDTLADAKTAGAITLNYGNFISAIVSFVLVAWVVFMLVKFFNKLRIKEAAAETPTKLSKEVEVLEEIRDLLKK